MASLQLRPTFFLSVPGDGRSMLRKICEAVEKNPQFQGQFRDQHALISMVESERHFWSPWLHLDIRTEGEQAGLFGRFSPHPSVWTAFMFSYLSLSVIAFFAMMVAVAQVIAKESTWAWWVLPICLLTGVLLWTASQIGQRLAHSEMVALREMIDELLESIHVDEPSAGGNET